MFKLDNFDVILFVSFSYKKLLQCSFYENLKNRCKIDFSAKNSKKFVYYNEELVTNSKFQTQLPRKLQRFRTCRKNKEQISIILFVLFSLFFVSYRFLT